MDVLSDIDEDNYDRAFAFLRPGMHQVVHSLRSSLTNSAVIQGASDMGARLSEIELQKSLDFCMNLFNPTSPEQHERLFRLGGVTGKDFLDVTMPVMDPTVLESALPVMITNLDIINHSQSDDLDSDTKISSDSETASETRLVLNKINARRVVHAEYAINNLESEHLGGFVVRLEKGRLGLAKSTG
jgi:flavine halogenase